MKDDSNSSSETLFRDRFEAGLSLAEAVAKLNLHHPHVFAIPRGGVIVGAQISQALKCPLHVLVAQKIATPGYPELSMGAIAEGGVSTRDLWVQKLMRATQSEIELATSVARLEQKRRARRYQPFRHARSIAGHTAVLVDDGIASGATVRAAIQALRTRKPEAIVLASPVGSPHTIAALSELVDHVVVLRMPDTFRNVSSCYLNFNSVHEQDVLRALSTSYDPCQSALINDDTRDFKPTLRQPASGTLILLNVSGGPVSAEFSAPKDAWAAVVFAHGSGSSRESPRNRYIAQQLRRAGMATLLMNLLTDDEAAQSGGSLLDFNIDLLDLRLRDAISWLRTQSASAHLPVAIIGSSVGAAAAMRTARQAPDLVKGVVCRSGRLDLAMEDIPFVKTPVLLIAGQEDGLTVFLNRNARAVFHADHASLVTIPGASHLFDEPGSLQHFISLTKIWLRKNLC